MTSNQVRYFLEIARCESFSKAAENLYVSHQTLSNQLKTLETELGIGLIDRSNRRRIRLTGAGRMMFEAWTEMQEIYEPAFQQARKLQEAENNSLVIGIQDMRFVRSYVVPIIRKLQDVSEAMNLEYRLGSPMEMLEMLECGQADMLIMISSDVNPENRYQYVVLRKEALHLVAAMAKSHPLAARKTLAFEDLKEETILMVGESYSGEAARRFRSDLEEHCIMPKEIRYFHGPRAINIAVETGAGVAILFDELLEEAREEIRTFPLHLTNAAGTDMLLVWKDPKFNGTAKRMIQMQRP